MTDMIMTQKESLAEILKADSKEYLDPVRTVQLCYGITGLSVIAGVGDIMYWIDNGNPKEDFFAAQKKFLLSLIVFSYSLGHFQKRFFAYLL